MNKPQTANRNNRKSMLPDQQAEIHIEMQISQDWAWHGSCSGFVLDWLAGGEACRRDIQGFSMRLENLLNADARQANSANQAGEERTQALRN